ncbi:M48 family metallopeptidase [bacterium]|jgi:predicted metal-dependent hydrolase|nr:M48 family metallopeptidase [bacterium]
MSFESAVEVIRRPRRRSLCIQVKPDNSVVVLAPRFVSKGAIDRFVTTKIDWIRSHQSRNKDSIQNPIVWASGGEVPYLGQSYKLIESQGDEACFRVSNGSLVIPDLEGQALQKKVMNWMRNCATDVITDRVEWYAAQMGLQPKEIKFRKMKSRWGSCSSRGTVSFNWIMLQAPLEVVDYVVVHELAHLKEMNHSKRFWDIVEVYSPNWKVHRQWLRRNQRWLMRLIEVG